MSPISDVEAHAHKLIDPAVPISAKIQVATEVRDSIELTHPSEYANFLTAYFKVVCQLLRSTQPVFVDNYEHRLRNVLLEILNRLPHTEFLRPYVPDLMKLSMQVLEQDNEDNALICLRIIFDLHKNFRPNLESDVQPFLDFVCKIYRNFKATVAHFFDTERGIAASGGNNALLSNSSSSLDPGGPAGNGATPWGSGRPHAPGGTASPPKELTPSILSFKMITECPLIVMFLFQLYPSYIQTNIPLLLPCMVETISVSGPSAVAPAAKSHFSDLKGAQVKTVSFLTYLLRSFAEYIRPHQASVSKGVVDLLVTCPDSVSIRKELLVATRHILATDFRQGFFPLIDTLLDERVLVGAGRACQETLRPLALSLLAELIHHVRHELALAQLSRVVYLFSCNVHDPSLPLSVQTTCVRLMLNLVESIYMRRNDALAAGRELLGRILDTFVTKFSTMCKLVPKMQAALDEADAAAKAGKAPGDPGQAPGPLADPSLRGAGGAQSLGESGLYLPVPVDPAKDLADCRQLLKTLIMGMKTLIWSITNHSHGLPPQQAGQAAAGAGQAPGAAAGGQGPPGAPGVAGPGAAGMVTPPVAPQGKGMTEAEVRIASGVLKSGLHCLALFVESEDDELLQHFSIIFPVMDERNYQDMLQLRLPTVLALMAKNDHLVAVVSLLLQNAATCRRTMDVLLEYLVVGAPVSQLEVLRSPKSHTAALQLRLFRLLFNAVGRHADLEAVLVRHLAAITDACLKRLLEPGDSGGVLQLMLALFRAVAGRKLDALHREFVPLLQPYVDALLGVLASPAAADPATHDAVVELVLTLPAQLSSLLSHLPSLMKPLAAAIRGSDALVALALRTFEFWVDSLNPEFLEPAIADQMAPLVLGLWSHLLPPPYPFGAKSLQLLGKLGGRNRRFFRDPLPLEYKENPEHGLRLILTFEPKTSFLVPLDRSIGLAINAVMDPQPWVAGLMSGAGLFGGLGAGARSAATNLRRQQKAEVLYCRQNALKFLRVCLASVINLRGNVALKGSPSVPSGAAGVGVGLAAAPETRDSLSRQLASLIMRAMGHVGATLEPEGAAPLPSGGSDVGLKTTMQLLAESSLCVDLLATCVAACAEDELRNLPLVGRIVSPPMGPEGGKGTPGGDAGGDGLSAMDVDGREGGGVGAGNAAPGGGSMTRSISSKLLEGGGVGEGASGGGGRAGSLSLSSVASLAQEALFKDNFMDNVSRHFAILFVLQSRQPGRKGAPLGGAGMDSAAGKETTATGPGGAVAADGSKQAASGGASGKGPEEAVGAPGGARASAGTGVGAQEDVAMTDVADTSTLAGVKAGTGDGKGGDVEMADAASVKVKEEEVSTQAAVTGDPVATAGGVKAEIAGEGGAGPAVKAAESGSAGDASSKPGGGVFPTPVALSSKAPVKAEASAGAGPVAGALPSASNVSAPSTETSGSALAPGTTLSSAGGLVSPPPADGVAKPETAGGKGGGGASASSSKAGVPPRTLKELDPCLYLDALVRVLCCKSRARSRAALYQLKVLVETVLLLWSAGKAIQGQSQGATGTTTTPAVTGATGPSAGTSGVATAGADGNAGVAADAGGGAAGSGPASAPPKPNGATGVTDDRDPSLSDAPPSRYPAMFDQLIPRLLHCCYKVPWEERLGGVAGIGLLAKLVPAELLHPYLRRLLQGLLFVLNHLSPYAASEAEEVSSTLLALIKLCDVEAIEGDVRPQTFKDAVEVLGAELFSPLASPVVHKTVQDCLALLGGRVGMEVSEILEPYHAPLLAPLLTRALRTKQVDAQVGTVTTLNYCLSLRPPLVRMSSHILQLLHDALAIGEADENAILSKFTAPKMVASVTRLRTACIELLCTAMAWNDFKATQQTGDIRSRIIGMFFKSLTCRTPEIVAVAKEGLRQVIQQHKMPKELLQSSLRPILVNLAHHKNLTMPLLHGLARLLELLSNWFNVTLGEKLMVHLRRWLEPAKLLSSPKSWKPGEEAAIGAAILELFHLLPSAASKFLEPLVELVIQMDAALPALGHGNELNSPYRVPLTKFLNRYASEAVDFFLARLAKPEMFRRFVDVLRSPEGVPLRDELARNPQKIIQHAFASMLNESTSVAARANPAAAPSAATPAGQAPGQGQIVPVAEGATGKPGDVCQFRGVALVALLVRLMPEWLPANPELFRVLQALWRHPGRLARLASEDLLTLDAFKETKRLVKCFLNYLRVNRGEVGTLFELLPVFTTRSGVDYTFLRDFMSVEVATLYTVPQRAAVLQHFLGLFRERSLPQEQLVCALQLLIMPLLSHAFAAGEGAAVVDGEMLKGIVDRLLNSAEDPAGGGAAPTSSSASSSAFGVSPPGIGGGSIGGGGGIGGGGSGGKDYAGGGNGEPLRVELLQLATLLLRHMPQELLPHRKELIKFGWNHLKREDSGSKLWAFVNVCHFLEVYQTPDRIILQVFVALLRTCQPEARTLVKQALDTLMPTLPKRLPAAEPGGTPVWIRYTKKVLVEEGHSLPHLIHLWHIVVRHSELFAGSQVQFVPQMVHSLARLGLPQNAPLENRKLAIDLVALILTWEKQRLARAAQPPGTAGAAAAAPPAGQGPSDGTSKTAAAAGSSIDWAAGDDLTKGGADAPVAVGSKRPASEMASLAGEDPARKRLHGSAEGGSGSPVAVPATGSGAGAEAPTPSGGFPAGGLMDAATPMAVESVDGSVGDFPLSARGPGGAQGVASGGVGGASAGGAGAGGGAAVPAGAPPGEEFRPSPAMEEMILNFLIRIAFLTEPSKGADRELKSLYDRALALLHDAVTVWPKTPLKLSYVVRLLVMTASSTAAPGGGGAGGGPGAGGGNAGAGASGAPGGPGGPSGAPSLDSSPALVVALDVLGAALTRAPAALIRANTSSVLQILEPAFSSKLAAVSSSFCDVLPRVFTVLPPETRDASPESAAFHTRLEDIIRKHLTVTTTDARAAAVAIAPTLRALEALAAASKTSPVISPTPAAPTVPTASGANIPAPPAPASTTQPAASAAPTGTPVVVKTEQPATPAGAASPSSQGAAAVLDGEPPAAGATSGAAAGTPGGVPVASTTQQDATPTPGQPPAGAAAQPAAALAALAPGPGATTAPAGAPAVPAPASGPGAMPPPPAGAPSSPANPLLVYLDKFMPELVKLLRMMVTSVAAAARQNRVAEAAAAAAAATGQPGAATPGTAGVGPNAGAKGGLAAAGGAGAAGARTGAGAGAGAGAAAASGVTDASLPTSPVAGIKLLLRLLSPHVLSNAESKKQFVQLLTTLIGERAIDATILDVVFAITSSWVTLSERGGGAGGAATSLAGAGTAAGGTSGTSASSAAGAAGAASGGSSLLSIGGAGSAAGAVSATSSGALSGITSVSGGAIISTGGGAALSNKELVALVQRLAQLLASFPPKQAPPSWEGDFLVLLHRLCSDAVAYPPSMRTEMFQKVEKVYMLGLRSSQPEMRLKFFNLYHESLGRNLSTRLQYIVSGHEWEAVGGTFWLKQGLDLLLSILEERETITLAPNSAQLNPLVPHHVLAATLASTTSTPLTAGTTAPGAPGGPSAPSLPTTTTTAAASILSPGSSAIEPTWAGLAGANALASGNWPPTASPQQVVSDVVSRHLAFLAADVEPLRVVDLVLPLRELAHMDTHLAHHLWVLVFPIVWATLQKDEQVTLAKPTIALLSKEYHEKQQGKRPNVVQALLEGISLCQPQPKIPSELIKFLGKTYNAWHIAIPLLESHVQLFPREARCFHALAELYRKLNEEDMLFGLWKRRCQTEETRAGLSFVQHGFYPQAQEVFYKAMSAAQAAGAAAAVTKMELCLWEEQWLECAKKLNQWDVVTEFARAVDHTDLMLDSLWRVPDWQTLKTVALPSTQLAESPRLKIVQAYAALQEGNVSEADRSLGQGMQLCLAEWWQLPDVGLQSHLHLLHQFHKIVDLQESARLLMDIGLGSRLQSSHGAAGAGAAAVAPHDYTELKNILEIWRLRLPNEWDSLLWWFDTMQWRNHMYNTVINAFKGMAESNPKLHQIGFRDKAWSVNKLAQVCRRHGLGDVCVGVLNKMYGFLTMEVQEAFNKIREQAHAYLDMKGELVSGVNLINTTNLEYFPTEHKSEMFRLKGKFLQRMGDGDAANAAFSSSISLQKFNPEGWCSWAEFCDRMYAEKGEATWLEYAVMCYLKSIECGSPTGRMYIARLLYLLSFDNAEGTVGRTLDKFVGQIPLWVWIPWIPQLLQSLQRSECVHVKPIVLKLALQFPQALYYQLRTYLLERRDMTGRAVEMAQRAAAMAARQQQQQQQQPSPMPQQQAGQPGAIPTTPGGPMTPGGVATGPLPGQPQTPGQTPRPAGAPAQAAGAPQQGGQPRPPQPGQMMPPQAVPQSPGGPAGAVTSASMAPQPGGGAAKPGQVPPQQATGQQPQQQPAQQQQQQQQQARAGQPGGAPSQAQLLAVPVPGLPQLQQLKPPAASGNTQPGQGVAGAPGSGAPTGGPVSQQQQQQAAAAAAAAARARQAGQPAPQGAPGAGPHGAPPGAQALAQAGAAASMNSASNPYSPLASFEVSKALMEALRTKHVSLAGELETILTEVGSRFVPLPEERLLAVLYALLHRCYKFITATGEPVPPNFKKELASVCNACFSSDSVTKHGHFVRAYKQVRWGVRGNRYSNANRLLKCWAE
eukprot:jgi/Mesvir1/70/Mv13673-RA.2